jgi:uncharacterized membrane protein YeaQ/YmgE (transglycosylase-associated protein family)
MNIVISLIVGAVVGWLASMLMRTDGREGLLRNVAAGVAGAYVAAGLWAHGSADQGAFSFGTMIASSLGATALLLLVKRLSRA